jgi:NTP pyrophosphatase (non-canonical NTP hydrolase)
MNLKEASERAFQLRDLFSQYEKQLYRCTWSREEIALGFVGDVGDLMKLIQAQEGVRNIPDMQAKLEHELADCLWSVLVLAQLHNVDIEAAFIETMDELEEFLKDKLQSE